MSDGLMTASDIAEKIVKAALIIDRHREALKRHAIVADYDCPGDTPELAGYTCLECKGTGIEADTVEHAGDCVLAPLGADQLPAHADDLRARIADALREAFLDGCVGGPAAADALAALSWQPKASAPRDGSVFRAGCWTDGKFSQCDMFFGKKHHACRGARCDDYDYHDKRHGYERDYFRCAMFEEKLDFDVWMPMPAAPNRQTFDSSASAAETGAILDRAQIAPTAPVDSETGNESRNVGLKPQRIAMRCECGNATLVNRTEGEGLAQTEIVATECPACEALAMHAKLNAWIDNAKF